MRYAWPQERYEQKDVWASLIGVLSLLGKKYDKNVVFRDCFTNFAVN